MDRRSLVAGSAAGLAALVAGTSSGGPASADEVPPAAIDALRGISRSLSAMVNNCTEAGCPLVEQVRTAIKTHYKANGRFPDFVEVGYDVFLAVYDWHLRARVEPKVVRRPEGRMTIVFMFTTVVLRNDVADNYVSVAYDAR
ncbi:MAG: hypothetical protein KJ061_01185 [Vicinamibacteraceae bacterium]|nr:hypothetical protein [Vicinamibacteraceae bacterium]